MITGFILHIEEYKNVKNFQKLYWKIFLCLERIREKYLVAVITQFLWAEKSRAGNLNIVSDFYA